MKKFIKAFGISTMFVFSLVMLITFFDAYASPTKSTRVFVNFFGEAEFEMFALGVIALIQIIAFFMILRQIKHEDRPHKNPVVFHTILRESKILHDIQHTLNLPHTEKRSYSRKSKNFK